MGAWSRRRQGAGGRRKGRVMRQPSVFCMLRALVGFFLLSFFSFLLIVMPICAHSLSLFLSLCSLGIVCRWNFWLSWGVRRRGGVAAASRRPHQVTTRTNLLCALSGLGSCCCYCCCCLARTRISSSSACLCRQFSLLLLLLFSKCFVFCFFFTVILIF